MRRELGMKKAMKERRATEAVPIREVMWKILLIIEMALVRESISSAIGLTSLRTGIETLVFRTVNEEGIASTDDKLTSTICLAHFFL